MSLVDLKELKELKELKKIWKNWRDFCLVSNLGRLSSTYLLDVCDTLRVKDKAKNFSSSLLKYHSERAPIMDKPYIISRLGYLCKAQIRLLSASSNLKSLLSQNKTTFLATSYPGVCKLKCTCN